MSILCGLPLLEGVYCLACARWAWKRCLHTAGHDNETWGLVTAEEFDPGPRLCYILAVYGDDPQHLFGNLLEGVAAMLTLLVVLHRDKLGNIDRRGIKCYTVAPVRCMLLNLAVRYADVINSAVLQGILSEEPLMKFLNVVMERQETLAREHSEEYMGALQRVVTLLVPHAYSSSKYGTFNEVEDSRRWSGGSSFGSLKTRENWDELIECLFDKDESGHMVLEKSQRDD